MLIKFQLDATFLVTLNYDTRNHELKILTSLLQHSVLIISTAMTSVTSFSNSSLPSWIVCNKVSKFTPGILKRKYLLSSLSKRNRYHDFQYMVTKTSTHFYMIQGMETHKVWRLLLSSWSFLVSDTVSVTITASGIAKFFCTWGK